MGKLGQMPFKITDSLDEIHDLCQKWSVNRYRVRHVSCLVCLNDDYYYCVWRHNLSTRNVDKYTALVLRRADPPSKGTFQLFKIHNFKIHFDWEWAKNDNQSKWKQHFVIWSLWIILKSVTCLKLFRLNYPDFKPPLWCSGQSSWLQIRRPGFDSGTTRRKQ
jgi:hypothetical protein